MEIRVKRMAIDNFKGIKHLDLDFGRITQVSAANGTGKSSIADAFAWVLTGKDSHGNAPGSDQFREKPLDQDGNEIHDLTTSVLIEATADGEPYNMRREQAENWVKPRGSANPVYQGNVSRYWINDVEVKVGEFKKRIGLLVPETIFPMIATMGAFNACKWQDRRKTLLSLTDINVDQQLLQSDQFQLLNDKVVSQGIHVDDIKKVLSDKQRMLKKDQVELPARIDEAQRSVIKFDDDEIRKARELVETGNAKISAINQQIAERRANSCEAQRQSSIAAKSTELANLKNGVLAGHQRVRADLQAEVRMAKSQMEGAERFIDMTRTSISKAELVMANHQSEVSRLREQYRTVFDQPVHEDPICPTCGQPMPEEMIEKSRTAAMNVKAAQLKRISADGKKAAELVENDLKQLEQLREDLKRYQDQCDEHAEHYASAEAALNAYGAVADYSTNPRIAELEAEIEAMQAATEDDVDAGLMELYDRRARLLDDVSSASLTLTKLAAAEENQKRVEELADRLRKVGIQFAENERVLMLYEDFVRARCDLLEQSVDNLFPTVRWKLFNTQINGGLAETCECMVLSASGSLVPYSTANTGAKLMADLEIIKALSDHHDVSLPVFFDNREALSGGVPDTGSQLIMLKVNEDPIMKVEIIK